MAHHIFFSGGLGSGKTFFMSAMAHLFKNQVEQTGGNVQLFSNYHLKDSAPMDSYEAWYEVADANESICCWDEAQLAFNNRGWSSAAAQTATEIMFYTRKMGCLTMYASPSIDNVDSRVRQIVEVLFWCRKLGDKGFEAYVYDYQINRFLRRVFMPMSIAKKLFALNLYDTTEMVKHFPLPDGKKETQDFWDNLFVIHNLKRERRQAREADVHAATLDAASDSYAQNDAGIYVQNV